MTKRETQETYYDVLKVDRKATISEIVQAYHIAKNAFSKDSVATYSLFSPEEAKLELEKLEQAYLHLSNVDRKRQYDRSLAGESPTPLSADPTSTQTQSFARPTLPDQNSQSSTTSRREPTVETVSLPGEVTGVFFRQARERRGLSIDDVSRVTKIPVRSIRAIEEDDSSHMPARVYVQGFIRNLTTLYRLDAATTTKAYLEHLNQISPPPKS